MHRVVVGLLYPRDPGERSPQVPIVWQPEMIVGTLSHLSDRNGLDPT